MATLKVGNYRFNIEPSTARWSYSMKINSIDTYGGRVVQLLSCKIDNLTVEGYIRPAKPSDVSSDSMRYLPYQGMRVFENNIRSIMMYHEQSRSPVRFVFSEVGWDGDVWLTGYSDVRYEPSVSAVRYVLKFDVDYGFDTVLESIDDAGEIAALDNIASGVNWVRSVYNTPIESNNEAVKKAIESIVDDAGTFDASKPLDYYEYLKEALGSGGSDDEEGNEGTDGDEGDGGKDKNGKSKNNGKTEKDDPSVSGDAKIPSLNIGKDILKKLGLVV